MRNKFVFGFLIGLMAIIGMGQVATQQKLIHQYPPMITLQNTDVFLVDTLSEYRSVAWQTIAGASTNIAFQQALEATNGLKAYIDSTAGGGGAGNASKEYVDASTNTLGIGLKAYTDQATNDLKTYVDFGTNFLGVGLRAYTDESRVWVVPGVNNTVVTNDNTFQVNMVDIGGGSATNVIWPVAGANMSGSTNVLSVTLNADVSLGAVAAKAGTNELASATNLTLSVATDRVTSATNQLWGMVNTNALASGLRDYTDQVGVTVLGTATTRITSATNSAYTSATAYATAATNALFQTTLSRIAASTNSIAAETLTGTINNARLSNITSNQIAADTDAAYRASGGDVTTAQLVSATNSTLSVATARTTAATNALWAATDARVIGATNSLWTMVVASTNALWTATDARVTGATNGLWNAVNTNGLGAGLRAYSDTFAVVSGVNTTVLTNGHVFQINAVGGGSGGAATNIVWPTAGANMTGATNNLTVTLSADVSLASVAAKASTNQLQSATNLATLTAMGLATTASVQASTNLATLAAMGVTTNGYVQAATNQVLITATTRITSATNTLWAMVDTNGLGAGLKVYVGVATNNLWNAVNTNGLATGLKTYTDNATNQVLLTATSRIMAATNGLLSNPTFTGGITVTGGDGTNEFYGINALTNMVYKGLAVRWITNKVLAPGPVTNTIIYLGYQ